MSPLPWTPSPTPRCPFALTLGLAVRWHQLIAGETTSAPTAAWNVAGCLECFGVAAPLRPHVIHCCASRPQLRSLGSLLNLTSRQLRKNKTKQSRDDKEKRKTMWSGTLPKSARLDLEWWGSDVSLFFFMCACRCTRFTAGVTRSTLALCGDVCCSIMAASCAAVSALAQTSVSRNVLASSSSILHHRMDNSKVTICVFTRKKKNTVLALLAAVWLDFLFTLAVIETHSWYETGTTRQWQEERKTRIMACLVAGKQHHGHAQRTLVRNGPPSVAAALVF